MKQARLLSWPLAKPVRPTIVSIALATLRSATLVRSASVHSKKARDARTATMTLPWFSASLVFLARMDPNVSSVPRATD